MRCIVPLAAVLVLGTLACELDFTGPEPVSSSLDLSVHMQESDDFARGHIDMSGTFAPGLDRTGARHDVLNDTLYVQGSAIAPAEVGPDGRRRYDATWSIPDSPGAGARLRITPPAIDGEDAPVLDASMIRRVGTRRPRVAADDPIELYVAAAEPLPSVDHRHWSLEVRDGGDGPLVEMRSDGAPPDTIVIPRTWLPDSAGAAVDVRLLVREQQRWAYTPTYSAGSHVGLPAPPPYSITLTVTSTIDWVVLPERG